MQNRLGKPALAAIIVACAGVAAYWYWSPYLALRSMQSAAVARDADALNAHVDYPHLRDSLKVQLSAQMAAQLDASTEGKNPLGALGATLGRIMSDKLVDAMVRPETIMRVMQSGQFGPTAPVQDAAPPAVDNYPARPKWIILREGVDKVIAMPENGAGTAGKQVKIVFERRGFAHWNLTDVRMPAP